MDDPKSATPGSGAWTQANDAELDAVEVGEALSLRMIRFLRLCWVKRQMVFGILATGILLSVLYALFLPNIYISTTTLMPPDSASSSNFMSLLSASGNGAAASAGSALLGVKAPGAIFIGILGSRTVQEGVVKQLDLVRQYKAPFVESACKRLAADTAIQSDLKSGIISISVKADSPVLASNIARGYVTELDRVVTNNSTSAARRERIFLEGRLKEIKSDLDDSSKALSQFSAKNRTLDIPSQGKAMMESGLKLQDQMVVARSELAGLRQSYSEDNVRVRAAQARVSELQRQMDKIMGIPEESTPNVNDSAYPSVSELPALGLTYSDLERKVRVEEVLWDALTRQYESARVQEAKEIPTVRVLDVANVPQRKSSPTRSRIVLLGAFLSLVVAFVVVRAASVWEEMGAQDEHKKLAREIIAAGSIPLLWFWHITGMNWVQKRLRKSEQQM